MSSGRFDPTEPPRTTVPKGEAGLQGWFERVPGGSTSPTGRFEGVWGVRPHRPEGLREFGAFDLTEPPRTTVTKGAAGKQGRFK